MKLLCDCPGISSRPLMTTLPWSQQTTFASCGTYFAPSPQFHPVDKEMSISPSLHDCSHVFLHRDAVQLPLSRACAGLHSVIKRVDRAIATAINGVCNIVLLNKIKPAYLEAPIDKNIQPHKGVTILKESAAPREKFPVGCCYRVPPMH